MGEKKEGNKARTYSTTGQELLSIFQAHARGLPCHSNSSSRRLVARPPVRSLVDQTRPSQLCGSLTVAEVRQSMQLTQSDMDLIVVLVRVDLLVSELGCHVERKREGGGKQRPGLSVVRRRKSQDDDVHDPAALNDEAEGGISVVI